jgi:hypothetical protein
MVNQGDEGQVDENEGNVAALSRTSAASAACAAAVSSSSFASPEPAPFLPAAPASQQGPKKSPVNCALAAPPPPPHVTLPSSVMFPPIARDDCDLDERGVQDEELHVTWGDDEQDREHDKDATLDAADDADGEWQSSQVRSERAAAFALRVTQPAKFRSIVAVPHAHHLDLVCNTWISC